jgi:hypothetical protein
MSYCELSLLVIESKVVLCIDASENIKSKFSIGN